MAGKKTFHSSPLSSPEAFACGIAFDASAIDGFGDEAHSDLLLHPDPDTLLVLPWRPEHGRVVRMFCDITYPDQRPFEGDTRALLKRAGLRRREFEHGVRLRRRDGILSLPAG